MRIGVLMVLGCWLSQLTAAEPAAVPWQAVDQALQRRFADRPHGKPEGFGLTIYDRQDHLVFSRMYGDFAAERVVAVASASKLISGALIFEAMRRSEGKLTLDSTTGEILGWKGVVGTITLRHLLSFTSGLPEDRALVMAPGKTLAEAVTPLADATPDEPPGVGFAYGSVHLQVAARMVEVVTGKSWNALFHEWITTPLHLPDTVAYYTFPRQSIGTTNPLIAGGLRASMAQYAAILGVIFHDGSGPAGMTLGTPELFSAAAREPFTVKIERSPMQLQGYSYLYGLTCWLETTTPRQGSQVVSSAGAFGFVPWIDRATGYYAVFGMEMVDGARFSFPIEQEVEPLIRNALK